MEISSEEAVKDKTDNVVQNNNMEQSPPPTQEPQKRSRREDRNKRDEKNVDQLLKTLTPSSNIEEKFDAVCKKYGQCADDNKKLQFYIKQSDKRYALLVKEKDQQQHEFNKTILVKSKLENLCRELQKQNRAIKEESLLKIREEEERRKEHQAKFQNTLSEITQLLQQNNEKNAKLRDDNISMTEKFKSVVQQYQLREEQVDKMAKQMALESQLSDAKLQKASLEHQAEKEQILSEMEQLKMSLAQYRAKIIELQGNEAALKEQLGVYTDKYDEFQNALVKSNQVFGGFKEQMEMMSKKIKKLEKESLSWKKRWETSQAALLEVCADKQARDERCAAAGRQLAQLQALCRALQAERTLLQQTLKENNIERPPLAALPPPPPAAHNDEKVDAMAANCVQLRQSLAHLQSQLNTLTNKPAVKEDSPKPEKPKKSKSKKNKDKQNTDKTVTKESSIENNDGTPNQDSANETEPKPQEDTVQNEVMEDLNGVNKETHNNTLDNLTQADDTSADIKIVELKIEEIVDDKEEVSQNEVTKLLDISQNGDDSIIMESSSNDEPLNIEVKPIPKVES